jgi:hypothetical protein
MIVNKVSGSIGKGLLAGFAGTVAMTVSSTLEAKLRRREFSTAPAQAAKKMLGIRSFESRAAEERFSNLVHWGYGTGWGLVRGLLRSIGLPSKVATPAHYGAVWGSALVTLPALGVAPPVYLWKREDVAIDVFHHLVYATAAGAAYELLDRRS